MLGTAIRLWSTITCDDELAEARRYGKGSRIPWPANASVVELGETFLER